MPHKKRINKVLFLILWCFSFCAYANNLPTSTDINRLLTEFGEDINIGIVVQNLQTNTILYQKNPTRYFAPASNQKLLTAYTALAALGANFHYQTQLILDAKKINGANYQGNIYLRFSGDPLLMSNQLDGLLQQLQVAGVNQVQGQLILDDSAFDQNFWPPGSSWERQQACYGAPISAIIINHNCNNNLPIKNPRSYAIDMLTQLLAKNHIKLSDGITIGRVPNQAKPWLIHYSPPLTDIINQMLKNGDYVIANALFKTIGGHYVKSQGNWKNGSKAMQAILTKNLKIRFQDIALQDGAGASHYTQITPLQLNTLLAKNYRQAFFVNALPVAGDGMLNKVRAKASNENSVVALSGYIQTPTPLSFVIIINGFVDASAKYQLLQNKICTILLNQNVSIPPTLHGFSNQ